MANHWFRIYSEIIDDEKIRMLAFEDRWHYVAILCCKNSGILDGENDLDFLNRRLGVKLGLQKLELESLQKRLIEVRLIDSNWQPLGWNNRQFLSDSDPTNADRQKRYREKKKHGNGSNALRNVSVTVLDTDTDTDTDTEKTNGRITFDQFYDAYPKKEKKQDALKAWKKIGDNLKQKILDDVEKRTALVWDDRKYIPAPSTYLNGKRWEDEIVAQKQPEQPQRTRKVI